MQLFYTTDFSEDRATLADQEATHCAKVLRHKVGDTIHLLDGQGRMYAAEIATVSKKKVELHQLKVIEEQLEKPVLPRLAFGILKNNTRLEWLIEKAVEIGVRELVPLHCTRSERSKMNRERILKIMVSAMKQSKQLWLPELAEVQRSIPWMESMSGEADCWIAHYRPDNHELNTSSASHGATMLIGPEGDFTDEEVQTAEQSGFEMVNMGSSRLRAETAGIVALTLLNNK